MSDHVFSEPAFAHMLTRVRERAAERPWSKLPGDFERDAVRRLAADFVPSLRKLIGSRISVKEAETFAALEKALIRADVEYAKRLKNANGNVVERIDACVVTLCESKSDISDTLIQYAVQEMFKGKQIPAIAKALVKKFHGSANMFLGQGSGPDGVINLTAADLEAALWSYVADDVVKGATTYKPGKEHFAIDGVLHKFRIDAKHRTKLKQLAIAKMGRDPFTSDDVAECVNESAELPSPDVYKTVDSFRDAFGDISPDAHDAIAQAHREKAKVSNDAYTARLRGRGIRASGLVRSTYYMGSTAEGKSRDYHMDAARRHEKTAALLRKGNRSSINT